MKFSRLLLSTLIGILFRLAASAAPAIHVWEVQELTFTAKNSYRNPYLEANSWIDLTGPGFSKRVYGFWDGGSTFRVRWVATQPGVWRWKSGSNPNDAGLSGQAGSVTVVAWTDAEKVANPVRRGFLKATANQHALTYADGTPFFAVGDTWYALGANRFRWYDDTLKRPIGPNAGFKDYVRLRKAQGYNWVSVIAAFPNWKTDDSSYHMRLPDSARTTLRSAWMEFGTGSAKNMDNEGGKPFLFPGKVPGYENYFPDMDRINPAYFRYLDRKIAYLNAHGFIPFMEASRRDASVLWAQYYEWPGSYVRYLQYFYARYQAYNTVLSPVHFDYYDGTISPADYTHAIQEMEKEYGPLPFGNLLSSNANPSTLVNWGDSSWVTLHQIGNKREHAYYWYLTEIYNARHPRPALNGEPYYAGYKDARGEAIGVNYSRGAEGGTDRDNALVRSCAYGSFLSGALAGHVYGAEGIWGADIEPSAPTHMWDAFLWPSGGQMNHLRTFAFSIGRHYQALEPLTDLVYPNKTPDALSYEGWAYCARTPDKNHFLLYFERKCPPAEVRGARLNSVYRAQWFNPRTGTWQPVGEGVLPSSKIGIIKLPELPDERDWGLRLVYAGPNVNNLRPPGWRNETLWEKTVKNMLAHRAVLPYAGAGMAFALLGGFFLGRSRRHKE
ncbi:hypothetical protein GCM10023189_33860 [Nibrella saemangeumensis]|uniref:DUF4038 domain-containing protein n=1 Tax=Nibrella saemangeumensis TaxID=1084526 RepID=A0ABP8N4J1_9BACT